MILSLRTDAPLARLALHGSDGLEVTGQDWQADRTLGRDLHAHIFKLLQTQKASWEDLTGIVIFRGPGSFTGLRIGITVANALGYGLGIPVVGETGDDWQKKALARFNSGDNDKVILPHYGSVPIITRPKR